MICNCNGSELICFITGHSASIIGDPAPYNIHKSRSHTGLTPTSLMDPNRANDNPDPKEASDTATELKGATGTTSEEGSGKGTAGISQRDSGGHSTVVPAPLQQRSEEQEIARWMQWNEYK